MFYGFVKVLMTVALRIFYRRIYITGLENIPEKGPAIIVPNHNSSLMDAALLGILIKRPLYFFARGDVFINRFVSSILFRFHMLPVHPHDGGRKTLEDNAESFSIAENILLKGGVVIFFPEGISHVDKQILPLRKGVFRLAFKTSSRTGYDLNIPLIPAGITYSHPTRWRSEVMVHLGSATHLKDYREHYLDNGPATLLRLAKLLHQSLIKLAPNVANSSLNDITVSCTEIMANEFSTPALSWKQATTNRLEQEKTVYRKLTGLPEQRIKELIAINLRYRQFLERFKLDDETLSNVYNFRPASYLLLFLGLPFFLFGYLLNCLPVLLVRFTVVRKVTREDFFSWIFVCASTILYLVWMVMIGVALAFWNVKLAIGAMIFMPCLGIFTLVYLRAWRAASQYWRLKKAEKESSEKLLKMRLIRQTLLDAVATSFPS